VKIQMQLGRVQKKSLCKSVKFYSVDHIKRIAEILIVKGQYDGAFWSKIMD
jgi:hypothetical protein